MAITGVMRPGHAQLRVLDIDVSRKFYRDVIGLVEDWNRFPGTGRISRAGTSGTITASS